MTQHVVELVATSKHAGKPCSVCPEKIREADIIISKTRRKHCNSKYYHKKCWESLYH